jgi:hypothetical protein
MAGGEKRDRVWSIPPLGLSLLSAVLSFSSLSLSSESSITLARHAHVGLSNQCPEAFSPTPKK